MPCVRSSVPPRGPTLATDRCSSSIPSSSSGAPKAVRDGRTVLASIDGRVVGFATLLGAGRCVELEDVFVHPDSMRRGVGRALITDLADRCRRAGTAEIQVDANAHALAFCDQVGFVAIGEVALEHGIATRMTMHI